MVHRHVPFGFFVSENHHVDVVVFYLKNSFNIYLNNNSISYGSLTIHLTNLSMTVAEIQRHDLLMDLLLEKITTHGLRGSHAFIYL